MVVWLMLCHCIPISQRHEDKPQESAGTTTVETVSVETVYVEIPTYKISSPRVIEVKTLTKTVEEPENTLSESDINLIALLTMAEAEGESDYGKRLVIDAVLNRMDSEHFPNTITDIVYQKNQFSSIWDGRVNRCYVKEDIVKLVREELFKRTNRDVIFFSAGSFSKYGKPLFQVENHCFSSYD